MNFFKKYDYKIYWILKKQLQNFRIRLSILKFKAANKFENEFEKVAIGNVYLWQVLLNVFKALIIISTIFFIEFIAQKTWINNAQLIPNWANLLIEYLPKPSYPTDEPFITEFVSLIASVSGVLLALFYPILATIASSGYSKVNASVRNLLFIEPVTQNYLRKLAFLTAYAVSTLFLMTIGFRPGNLALTILLFLCLFSLFNLLKLGSGVYNLFEPETLSRISNKLIIKNIRNVTIKERFFSIPNFQKYFRVKAEKQLDTLKLIHKLSYSEIDVNEKSLLNTTEQVFNLLGFYLSVKPQIPINSQWFRERQYHKSYFETDSTDRELSINTRTYVFPKKESDNFWFENEILDIYSKIGNELCDNLSQRIKYEYIRKSSFPLRLLGREFEFKLAERLLKDNLDFVKKSINHNARNSYNKSEENLILAEGFIFSLRYLYDEYFTRVEFIDCNKFNLEIRNINWDNSKSIYKSKIPSKLYKFLEEYIKYVKNEKIIYEKQITPFWYIEQHISAEYLLLVTEGFKRIINYVAELLYPLINECVSNKNHLLASFICHNAIELIDKLEYRLPSFLCTIKSFDTNNKYKGQFKWASLDEKEIRDGLGVLSSNLLEITALYFPNISKIAWNDNFPDIFAQSFSLVSNGLNKCMVNKDIEGYKKLITQFIRGGLDSFMSLHDRYNGKYIDEFELIYQIHLELMQISGLSYVYTEITGIDFWKETIKAWENYKIDEALINRIVLGSYGFIKFRKIGLGINYYDNFERKKDLLNFIKKENIDTSKFNNTIMRHYLRGSTYNNYDFEDIFLELYLLTFIESKAAALYLNKTQRRDFFREILTITLRKYGD